MPRQQTQRAIHRAIDSGGDGGIQGRIRQRERNIARADLAQPVPLRRSARNGHSGDSAAGTPLADPVAHVGDGNGVLPQDRVTLVNHVNNAHQEGGQADPTHLNNGDRVPSGCRRRVVSNNTAASNTNLQDTVHSRDQVVRTAPSVTPGALGNIHQPRLRARVTDENQEQGGFDQRRVASVPVMPVVREPLRSRNPNFGSITTARIASAPIKMVNKAPNKVVKKASDKPVNDHGNKYRGKDPVKRAVSNPKLRTILSGKKYPRPRNNANLPIARMGVHPSPPRRTDICKNRHISLRLHTYVVRSSCTTPSFTMPSPNLRPSYVCIVVFATPGLGL
ncbi:unnamed protein product [Periconia digitata]|uniref:Uncharacterized protein n=1 Tax=Periconia digitata TaxID=1303443 RepID=A0A9W4XFZ6_9PLEO|nr:unnamed protein product [Periconia digitata]